MRRNQIGTVFIISMLAITGIGVSFAGMNEIIHIYGTASTATVTFDVVWYSGTWVWKVWGWDGVTPDHPNDPDPFTDWGIINDDDGGEVIWDPAHEILIYRGNASKKPTDQMIIDWLSYYPGSQFELQSYGIGRPANPANANEINPVTNEIYDGVIDFWQVMPEILYTADIVIHYTGCIPAKVMNDPEMIWTGTEITLPDGTVVDWTTYLKENTGQDQGMYSFLYHFNSQGPDIEEGDQLHYCDLIKLEVGILLPDRKSVV